MLTQTKPSEVTLSITKHGTIHQQYQKLVFEEYSKRDWVNPAEYPEGVITDKFDAVSESLVILRDDEVLAGMRIVPNSHLNFPHENELQLTKFGPPGGFQNNYQAILSQTPRDRMAEITRVAGKVRHQVLLYNMAKCLYWYAQKRGLDLYVMVIDLDLFQLCNRLGLPVYPIGIPTQCEGSWTFPCITPPSMYPEKIIHVNHGWKYIEDPANLDGSWGL